MKPLPTKERIMLFLQDRARLKAMVLRIFSSVSSPTNNLDVNGLRCFRALLLQELGLPSETFGDILTDCIRFDFNGTGKLEVNEVYKLTKFHLWEYWKKLRGPEWKSNIPYKSLELGGYKVLKELGKGSQAVVKLCKNYDGLDRCIKCYSKDEMAQSGVEMLVDEFEAMQLLGCKRIANTFEIFQDARFYYLVNEVYYGGDFQTVKRRAQDQGVCTNEDWWRKLFKQCLRALEFMHQQAMIHCDIKEPNLMLKTHDLTEPDVVVVDFGIAKAMGAGDTNSFGGTPGYIPPETLQSHKWFPGGDIFSLGVVIFQMMTDNVPNEDAYGSPNGLFVDGCSNLEEIITATLTREPRFEKMPPEFPGLLRLTRMLLQKHLANRPNALRAMEDTWFKVEALPASNGLCSGKEMIGSNASEQPHVAQVPRESGPLRGAHPLASVGIVPEFIEKLRSQEQKMEPPPVALKGDNDRRSLRLPPTVPQQFGGYPMRRTMPSGSRAAVFR